MHPLFRSAAIAAVIVGTAIVLFAYMFADRIIFQPPLATYTDGPEILKLVTGSGNKISAIYLPNEGARFTILYSHGNAEDLGSVRYKLEELRELGFSVLGYDYEGYGTSEGNPSEEAAYHDVDAAYDYLVRVKAVPAECIIVHGWSFGGAVSADLALRRPVTGLVLESTFVSAFRVVTTYPILPFDRFRTAAKLERVHCPVLVIHGTDDEVIGLWNGKMLFEKAHEPKRYVWIQGGRHGNLSIMAREEYQKALKEFASNARCWANVNSPSQ